MCLLQSLTLTWVSAVGPGQSQDTGQDGPLVGPHGLSYIMFVILGHRDLNAFDFCHLLPAVGRMQQILQEKTKMCAKEASKSSHLFVLLFACKERALTLHPLRGPAKL